MSEPHSLCVMDLMASNGENKVRERFNKALVATEMARGQSITIAMRRAAGDEDKKSNEQERRGCASILPNERI